MRSANDEAVVTDGRKGNRKLVKRHQLIVQRDYGVKRAVNNLFLKGKGNFYVTIKFLFLFLLLVAMGCMQTGWKTE